MTPGAPTDSERSMVSAPAWLRDLGFASWLLVGFVLVIVGLVFVLGDTSPIVLPRGLGAVRCALVRRGLPRAAGCALVLLGLVVIGAVVFALIVHGISSNTSDISSK